jgi:pilus assembly protein TadC
VFGDMTLDIIILLERDGQDTGFQMSVGINISAPLRAVKRGRMPSARFVHMTREAEKFTQESRQSSRKTALTFQRERRLKNVLMA